MAKQGLLVVLCSVCSYPLAVKEEYLVLYSSSLSCPICKQTSAVTEDLREYILKTYKGNKKK